MALKGINYKIRCVETQRNIYDFKRQLIKENGDKSKFVQTY